MPTEITGQNGAVIRQTTGIVPTGCPKALTASQKLTVALKLCRKKQNKAKRQACERAARKKYGAKASRTSRTGRR